MRIFCLLFFSIGLLFAQENSTKINIDHSFCNTFKNDENLPSKISELVDDEEFMSCVKDYFNGDFLDDIITTSSQIRGDNIDCIGMQAVHNYKTFKEKLLIAMISPQAYQKGLLSAKDADLEVKRLRDYLKFWAYKSLNNFKIYKKFSKEYKEIVPLLVQYYVGFGYDEGSAVFYANRVANEFLHYSVAGVGDMWSEFRFSDLETSILNPLFDTNALNEYLLEKDPSTTALTNALNIAILENKSLEFLDALIKRGANVNSGDENSLFFALSDVEANSKITKYDYISFLLSKGADINYKNSFGKTPIFYAAEFDDVRLVDYLIQNGAKLNQAYISNADKLARTMGGSLPFYVKFCALNHTSKTLFMHAAHHSSLEIVKKLITLGVNINGVDDLGYNALDYANESKNNDVVNYLKTLGLKQNSTQGEVYE